MNNKRPSLGVVLVAMGNPRVRSDLRMTGFSSTASLDDVCSTLAATGDVRFETLRHNALAGLGKYVGKRFSDSRKAAEWLVQLNRRLGAWAAVQTAKHVVSLIRGPDERAVRAIAVTERWCAGLASRMEAREAAEEAYRAYEDSEDAYYNAYSTVTEAAYSAATESKYAAHDFAYSAAQAAVRYVRGDDMLIFDVIVDSLPAFPVWQGDPSQDTWPLPKRKR